MTWLDRRIPSRRRAAEEEMVREASRRGKIVPNSVVQGKIANNAVKRPETREDF
jgi:hypothetical protein